MTEPEERWGNSSRYERYMGRWSRLIAGGFVRWLNAPRGQRWLDVGCGTGALARAVLDCCAPQHVVGVDPSEDFVSHAREQLGVPNALFCIGVGEAIPLVSGTFEVAASGLALNFMPDPAAAVAEMYRVAAPGGRVAVYVWDYAGGMEWLRLFWDAAAAVNPAGLSADEGQRYPLCQPEPLQHLLTRAGLTDVTVGPVEEAARFTDFDDYWLPFLAGGQAPAPRYLLSKSEAERTAIREELRRRLPFQEDGSIVLTMRAWAAQGTR